MIYKSIRITDICYNKMSSFIVKKGYSSRSEFVESMIDFFISHGLDPRSTLNLNIQSSMEKINDDFLKRDNSFRKWFGHLNNKKISLIIKQQEDILKQNEELKNVLLGNLSLNIASEIKEEITPISADNTKKNDDIINDEMLLKFEKVIESKEKIISSLQTKLNILTSKAKEEKTTFGKQKYVIELSPVEFENLKE